MPKLKSVVSDEMLLSNGVYNLDPATPLLASQAGLLLSRSKTRLDSDRRDGKPPPSYKDGGKVLYRLGDVLNVRKELQETATGEHQRGKAPKTFTEFMSFGGLFDTWPMVVGNRPRDFFSSLGEDIGDDEIQWMTMDDILDAVRTDARRVHSERERALIRDALGDRSDNPDGKDRIF